MDVLGTPIAELPPCVGPALLISDLHIPETGGRALERLDYALAAARRHSARLFVLGDLFDSYVSRRQIGVGVWRDVAVRFAAAVGDGVALDVIPGNRDFLLGAEFVEHSRARLHPGGMRLLLGGVDTLMLHGDELCQNDVPYQRAKRWLRSGAVRAIGRRLPLGLALKAAARARRKSAMVTAEGDQSRFLPTRAAVTAAFETGAERLVFGHIHRHATGAFALGDPDSGAAERRYWVLPAFDETGIGFRADGRDFAPVRFVDFEGATETVAEPGACPFPG